MRFSYVKSYLSLKWPIQGIHSLHGYVVNVEYSKVITVFLRGFDRMLVAFFSDRTENEPVLFIELKKADPRIESA